MCLCRVKQMRIHNSCEYVNREQLFHDQGQSKLTQPVQKFMSGETNMCFVRSKLMNFLYSPEHLKYLIVTIVT